MIQDGRIMKKSSILVVWLLVCTGFLGLIQFGDEVGAIVVPIDYPSIQSAIENASDGETIYVWAGTYYENIIVDKTVTIIGNGSGNTIIDGAKSGSTLTILADWVNVSGLTISNASDFGLIGDWSSNTLIDDCQITECNFGILVYGSINTTVNNTIISSNGIGIFVGGLDARYTKITGCTISDNMDDGIRLDSEISETQIIDCDISGNGHTGIKSMYNQNTDIINCSIWNNQEGVSIQRSNNILVERCDIFSNTDYGALLYQTPGLIADCNITSNGEIGLLLASTKDLVIQRVNISNHNYGLDIRENSEIVLINSSLQNCAINDIIIDDQSKLCMLNSTFEKSNVQYKDPDSELTVMWYMHVYLNDTFGNPVSNAEVMVRNETGIVVFNGLTDVNGRCNWITLTEYIETQGERVDYAPYNVTCYNQTLAGWAQPDPIMDSTMLLDITLDIPKPAIDYIEIQEVVGGDWVGDRLYVIEDTVEFFAVGFNSSFGFVGPVSVDWSSNDTGVGDVNPVFGASTTFIAIAEGVCNITAQNGSITNTSGKLTVIWLVENLDQSTYHPGIQSAIDGANPGDRLSARPWRYLENVKVNKTVTLTGQDVNTTVVDGNGVGVTMNIQADWVNVSGLSLTGGDFGILIEDHSNTEIDGCYFSENLYGLVIGYSINTTVNDTKFTLNYITGIYIAGWDTRDTVISGCNISNNYRHGINLEDGPERTRIVNCNISQNDIALYSFYARNLLIEECFIWDNDDGIVIMNGFDFRIANCSILSSWGVGLYNRWSSCTILGCDIGSNGYSSISIDETAEAVIERSNIFNSFYGMEIGRNSHVVVVNSTISNSTEYDIYLEQNSEMISLNTTFDRNSVYYDDPGSQLTVRWYMHVYTDDTLGNPVPNTEVSIRNNTGVVIYNGWTSIDGICGWITLTEYIENQSVKSVFTPHNVTCSNETLSGWAVPEPDMDCSKLVSVTLNMTKPTIDYIIIEEMAGGGWVGARLYVIEDTAVFYSVGYNLSSGYVGLVSTDWSSNNTIAGDVDPTSGTSTTFSAIAQGVCHVTAQNGSLINDTGTFTIIWLVKNLDQGTFHPGIQNAINAANTGDTLYAKSWVYLENIIVNKTVTLMGQDVNTTVVDGNGSSPTMNIHADGVNISGFTLTNGDFGILNEDRFGTKIDDCVITDNQYGLVIFNSNNTTVNNSMITSNLMGIYVLGWDTRNTEITLCDISNNQGDGIWLDDDIRNTQISGCVIRENSDYGIYSRRGYDTVISECNITNNHKAIYFESCTDFTLKNCNIFFNIMYAIHMYYSSGIITGCSIISNGDSGIVLFESTDVDIQETDISSHIYGMYMYENSAATVTNSSITDCTLFDIHLGDQSQLTMLNSTFDKNNVEYNDAVSKLTVRWYLHVYVNDSMGTPASNAEVEVRNATGTLVFDGLADADGYSRWIVVTEYIENQTERYYHTPHNITGSLDTFVGWAIPEPNIEISKFVNVMLMIPEPTIDFIRITDGPNGTIIDGGIVGIDYRAWGNCSAYNSTTGYIGLVEADWNAKGGSSYLLGPTPSEENGIDVGDTSGSVWFNASHFDGAVWFNTSVVFIPTFNVDYIEITDFPNGEFLAGGMVSAGHTQWGYCSAYNHSGGFVGLVNATWTTQGGSSSLLWSSMGNSNEIDVGFTAGDIWFNASYNGLYDSVQYLLSRPTEPRNLQVSTGESYVNLSWEAPEQEGSATVEQYVIYRGTAADSLEFLTSVTNALYFLDTGVTNGETYYYSVSAESILGEGPLSDGVNITVGEIPSAPLDLTAAAGQTFVDLTWNQPASDGGLPISSYQIYRGAFQGSEVLLVTIGNVLTYRDSDVENGTTFYYRVSALNSFGEGPLSNEAEADLFWPPTAPWDLTASYGDSYVHLEWEEPTSNGGSSVTQYKIYRSTASDPVEMLVQIDFGTHYNDTDLTNGETYYYYVRAVNGIGEGPQSGEVNATPFGVPLPVNVPPVCIISHPSDGDEISGVFWITGLASDSDGVVQKVEIRIDEGNWMPVLGNESWTYELDTTDFSNGPHSITVRAFDGENHSLETSIDIQVDNPSSQSKAKGSIFEDNWFWLLIVLIIAVLLVMYLLLSRIKRKSEWEDEIIGPAPEDSHLENGKAKEQENEAEIEGTEPQGEMGDSSEEGPQETTEQQLEDSNTESEMEETINDLEKLLEHE